MQTQPLSDPGGDLRIALAAALRLAARFELHEGIDNHFSYLLDDGTFLINRWGMHWSEVRAADLLRVDRHGKVIEGQGSVELTALVIHSEIHHACPDARAILHTHMPFATAIACTGATIEPISQNALRFHNRIFYDDGYTGLANETSEGQRLAGAVQQCPIVFLRHHGVIVTAPTIGLAFDDLYFLERTARVQILAHASGARPLSIAPAVVAQGAAQLRQIDGDRETHFTALCRLLDNDAAKSAAALPNTASDCMAHEEFR